MLLSKCDYSLEASFGAYVCNMGGLISIIMCVIGSGKTAHLVVRVLCFKESPPSKLTM